MTRKAPEQPLSSTERLFAFVLDNSLLLVIGALAALVWANVDLERYTAVSRAMEFAVNDIGMVFFFALAMKEVVEAMLPGGPLSSPREGALPILAAIGGMAGPAGLYLLLTSWMNLPELTPGWAIPCATDIAFSYLVARIIFPSGHPAIPFLLLLAIADDALGLIVLAIFYPSGEVSVAMLVGLLVPAMFMAWTLRRFAIENFWLYVFGPGLLSWLALFWGGLHPALALVPILPMMPHQHVDIWPFGRTTAVRLATVQSFESWWKLPVQFVLLAFGFVNAGVPFSAVGAVTWIVAASLVVGKPIGILAMTWLAELVGFRRATGLDYRAMLVVGITAGIGFTVALFFTTASFPPGQILSEAKMGALFSFFASVVAIAAGQLLGIRNGFRRNASAR